LAVGGIADQNGDAVPRVQKAPERLAAPTEAVT